MDLNMKGHCFLNKFLVFMLPHAMYHDSNLLEKLLQQVFLELKQLFHEGIFARGRYWQGR